MIPLAVPNISGNEGRYLRECIETTFVSTVGPFVNRFEEDLAKATGATAAVATSTGTAALHAALDAIGVGRDDLVILPDMTFIASANAVSYCGATPWLFDVDPASWTLDPQLVKDILARETRTVAGMLTHAASGRRIAAIMPVYALGHPADMDALTQIAQAFDLPVIADAAAAIGATYKGRLLGQMGATLSTLSFNGNKTITSGGGGAVIGQDNELLRLVKHTTTTARVGRDYSHDRVGFNYRMTNLEAAVGCAQLERLDEFVAVKRKIAARYTKTLCDEGPCEPLPAASWAESACWFSGVVLPEGAPSVDRIINHLRENAIDARPFWRPMHLLTPYAQAPRTDTPIVDSVWRRVLTLPCSTNLSEEDQETVIATVRATLA